MFSLPPLSSIPQEIVAVADYQAPALARLSELAALYLQQGVADEVTLRENCAALARIRLQNKIVQHDLQRLNAGHTRLKLFGHEYQHPLFLAPVSYQALFHPQAEIASAWGAAAMAAPMLVSSLATRSLEEIAAAAASPLWLQLYLQNDWSVTCDLIARAENLGYQALVLTVDTVLNGVRNREQRAGFALPPQVRAVNLPILPIMPIDPAPQPSSGGLIFGRLPQRIAQALPNWDTIELLLKTTRLPLILKGVLSVSDALRARELGVAGLIISNHGGRSQDGLVATIDALPPIAQAVGQDMALLLDGGIRRGSDVFKALALGAHAVCIGRPYIWGLATAGALGVAHVLRILREELEMQMVMNGCTGLDEIRPDFIWRA